MSRVLDLDKLIEEQERIMEETCKDQDKDPQACLRFGTAQVLKRWLLHQYAIQKNMVFSGEWIIRNGEAVCSVCWLPREISRLPDGRCSFCGAKNE